MNVDEDWLIITEKKKPEISTNNVALKKKKRLYFSDLSLVKQSTLW